MKDRLSLLDYLTLAVFAVQAIDKFWHARMSRIAQLLQN